GALEVGQHVGGRPARIAQLPPVIVVLVLAADIDHAVDRTRPAQYLAARPVDRAVVGAGIWFRLEHPVHRLVRERLAVAKRNMDPEIRALAAGFEQDDGRRGVLAEPRGHHAARRARADHYEIRLLNLARTAHRPFPSAFSVTLQALVRPD